MYVSSEKETALDLPHLGVRFLAESNSWIFNATLNLRTVSQMLRVLSQLASAKYVFGQPSLLFFS